MRSNWSWLGTRKSRAIVDLHEPSSGDKRVQTAEELDVAVGQPASEASGPVQAPWFRAKINRIGDEFLDRQLRHVQMASGEPL